MAVHNTDSDAANTAVRSLLTSIGKYYWGSTFNTGSGSGKKMWEEIRDDIFEGACAYCGRRTGELRGGRATKLTAGSGGSCTSGDDQDGRAYEEQGDTEVQD